MKVMFIKMLTELAFQVFSSVSSLWPGAMTSSTISFKVIKTCHAVSSSGTLSAIIKGSIRNKHQFSCALPPTVYSYVMQNSGDSLWTVGFVIPYVRKSIEDKKNKYNSLETHQDT